MKPMGEGDGEKGRVRSGKEAEPRTHGGLSRRLRRRRFRPEQEVGGGGRLGSAAGLDTDTAWTDGSFEPSPNPPPPVTELILLRNQSYI
ncbi:hypothetical protein KFK09_010373 [Dendrobium nobile]|uniref:Uncharacterized protein n=1 Tax=Dendrobium nobile TaxID=94219 RepID=A0A8T3BBS9_DENNO|nr:hypothetical protein KFK09_010373 [Dendrobium nobile]